MIGAAAAKETREETPDKRSRSRSPHKSSKKAGKKSKKKATADPGLSEEEDNPFALLSPVQSSRLLDASLDSPSALSAEHSAAATALPHSPLPAFLTAGLGQESKVSDLPTEDSVLLRPSVGTVDLASPSSRPSSPEKKRKSSKSKASKKPHKSSASPSSRDRRSSKERGTIVGVGGAHAITEEGGGEGEEGIDSRPTTAPAAASEEVRDVDSFDPSGSMRFASPSKIAQQHPSMLLQQPSRVLQQILEEQQTTQNPTERKFYYFIFYVFLYIVL